MEKELSEYWVMILHGDLYDNDTFNRQIFAVDDSAAWAMAEFIEEETRNQGYREPCINGLFKGHWVDKPQE